MERSLNWRQWTFEATWELYKNTDVKTNFSLASHFLLNKHTAKLGNLNSLHSCNKLKIKCSCTRILTYLIEAKISINVRIKLFKFFLNDSNDLCNGLDGWNWKKF